MRYLVPAAAILASLLLGGCGTLRPQGRGAGAELIGRSALLEPARGQASTLYFESGGTVRSVFGTRQASGRWSLRNKRLCFLWAGNHQECWPYAVPLRPRQSRIVTSDRGNVVKVTLR